MSKSKAVVMTDKRNSLSLAKRTTAVPAATTVVLPLNSTGTKLSREENSVQVNTVKAPAGAVNTVKAPAGAVNIATGQARSVQTKPSLPYKLSLASKPGLAGKQLSQDDIEAITPTTSRPQASGKSRQESAAECLVP